MVRSVSRADEELIRGVAAVGVVVSAAQLERWRAAGVLPAHERRWLGRGRGSVSAPAEGVVPIAAALGRHARPGRDLRWTVIAWYAEAGRPALPGAAEVPEPPWSKVRDALLWAVRWSRTQRLLATARTASVGGEEAQDDFYAEAWRVLGRGSGGPPHPDEARRVLEGEGTQLERGEGLRRRRGAVRLAAAAGMGAGEVGGEALVDAFAALMPGLDWAPVAEAARCAEDAGTLDGWVPDSAVDPLAALQMARAEETATARSAAHTLAGYGALYLMHGLGMPDTPALAGLRRQLDESGLALIVSQMALLMTSPSGVPHALAMGLAPETAALACRLESVLIEQITRNDGLLRLPGTEASGPEAYMQGWLDHLNDLTERARRHKTAREEPPDDLGGSMDDG